MEKSATSSRPFGVGECSWCFLVIFEELSRKKIQISRFGSDAGMHIRGEFILGHTWIVFVWMVGNWSVVISNPDNLTIFSQKVVYPVHGQKSCTSS